VTRTQFPGIAWAGIVFLFILGMASLGEDLLGTVNKLQDLVFNTIGNDSLDLPQIVRSTAQNYLYILLAFRRKAIRLASLS